MSRVLKGMMKNVFNCSLNDNLTFFTPNPHSGTHDHSCWDYWQNIYYPSTVTTSYPVYIQDRAKDNGRQAFEIIKMLQDKKLMNLKTVRDFIDAMDLLIKIL